MRTMQLWFPRKSYLFVGLRMKFVLFRHTFHRSFINSHGKFKSVKFKLLLSLPPTRIFASISFSSRKIIFRNFWEAFLGCAKLAGSSKLHCRVLLLLIINLKSLSFMEHGVNKIWLKKRHFGCLRNNLPGDISLHIIYYKVGSLETGAKWADL